MTITYTIIVENRSHGFQNYAIVAKASEGAGDSVVGTAQSGGGQQAYFAASSSNNIFYLTTGSFPEGETVEPMSLGNVIKLDFNTPDSTVTKTVFHNADGTFTLRR